MEKLLLAFLLTSSLAVGLNVLFKKFEIPTIIGYIVTGIFISEVFDFKSNEDILHLAEFGIVFLMFTIGLEFSFRHLMTMKKEVFLNGSLQVVITGMIIASLMFYFLDISEKSALIIGLAMALSSTAIVLKTLNDNGEIAQIYGRKALGILLFQDIAVIPILLMIDIFSSQGSSISALLFKTIISASILLIMLFLLGKYVINWILYKVIQTNSNEIFITTILILVVGASTLAHSFGFSFSLGAFLAGMMMAETQYKHRIEADLIPFRDLLLGLFFISVGMQINLNLVFNNIAIILLLLLAIMFIKAVVVFSILSAYLKKRDSAKTAFSIFQIGEFSLAVFGLMSARNLLDNNHLQIFIATAVLSMFITPFVLKNLSRIVNLIEIGDDEISDLKPQKLSGHFVVFGYGRLGQEVVLKLKNQGLLYIVLENDINLVELGRKRKENVFLGNAALQNTFDNACLNTAAAVIITVANEQMLDLISRSIANYNNKIQTIIRFKGQDERVLFSDLGDNFHLISEEKSVARILVQEALLCKINEEIKI